MKRMSFRVAVAALAGFGVVPSALAAPHAFESPPILSAPSSPSAPAAAMVAAVRKSAAPTGCDLQAAISRKGAIVSLKLDFVRAKFSINNPDPTDPQPNHEDPVELRSYGGCKSGPAVFVEPGDTLRVDLVNHTDPYDPSCFATPPASLGQPALVGCFNTTNLHTHGLHVSPTGNSDNVLLNIAPNTEFPYEINIPADHPAGTFWYHAHRHGSTAVQVASGASGALIIADSRPYKPTPDNPHPIADIGTVLHYPPVNGDKPKPFEEKLFLLQQIAYACFQNLPGQGGPWQALYTSQGLYSASNQANANSPWTCPLATADQPVSPGVVENFALQLDSATIWDTNGRFTSINGVVQPEINVAAGDIQRWRFIHSGIHDTVNLQIVRATPYVQSKATPGVGIIAAAALSGNRQQQIADVKAACEVTPDTLIPQFEIATDGLTRTKIHTILKSQNGGNLESNYLQPGYRSDILAVFPAEGDYCLLDQAAPAAERATNGNGGGQGPSAPQLLAYVHVKGGHAVTGDLLDYVEQTLYDGNPDLDPSARDGLRQGNLTPWAPFVELPPATNREVQHADFAINFPAFTINGKSYDPDVVNITRQVDTSDDWVLSAQGEPHIFHIHVNPFEVMDVMAVLANGQQVSIFDKDGHCRPEIVSSDSQSLANQYCGMYHVFRDTVIVENGYKVRLRTKYDRYIGEYVIHCHILDHEDSGMMLNINIVPDLKAPKGGLGMAMPHAMQMQMKQ